MENPTKFYSDRQETAVAKYLGWKRVAASGARPFNKGDVQSDRWLCECKTHTAVCNDYKISFSVWRKLLRESTSCMRRPVLIVDTGTQKIEDQCVIIPMTFYDLDYELKMYDPIIDNESDFHIRQNEKSFSFSSSVTSVLLKKKYCIRVKFNDIDVVIMPIEFFKELVDCE